MEKIYKYADLTGKVIRASMNVHSMLGNGFQEVIYQRCLALELEDMGINFTREIEMPLYYKDIYVGTRRADFVVEEKLLVELKAIAKIDDLQYAQIINYLNVYKLEIGLLINFGEKSLRFKRFINNEFLFNKNTKSE
jgi:GxxExxY protein